MKRARAWGRWQLARSAAGSGVGYHADVTFFRPDREPRTYTNVSRISAWRVGYVVMRFGDPRDVQIRYRDCGACKDLDKGPCPA